MGMVIGFDTGKALRMAQVSPCPNKDFCHVVTQTKTRNEFHASTEFAKSCRSCPFERQPNAQVEIMTSPEQKSLGKK